MTTQLDNAPMLRDLVRGEVITPDQGERYETARLVEDGTADLHPVAVVRPADVADVQAVVRFARERAVPLAVRGGGHSNAGFGTIEGGIVLDMSALKDVRIDPEARVARAGAGVTAGEYVRAAGEHGLTTPFGDTAAVGVAGITLGGGVGLLTRAFGMTIDALLGVEIVTADGRLRTVDAEHDPDLFWALRGGGGNFGVVTSLTFRLFDVPVATGGLLALPATPEVLAGYVAAAERAPAELTTIVTVMPCPPVPFVPPEQHGKPVLFTQVVHVGDPEEAQRALAPFRALATPYADLIRTAPYAELLPDEEIPRTTAVSRTHFLDAVDETTAARIIAGIAESPAPMRILQLRVLGGAMAAVPAGATAFGFRDRRIVTYLAGMYGEAEQRPAVGEWADRFTEALAPRDRTAYVNFLGSSGPATARDAYPAPTWDRLARVKSVYDPENLFRRNHNITPNRE